MVRQLADVMKTIANMGGGVSSAVRVEKDALVIRRAMAACNLDEVDTQTARGPNQTHCFYDSGDVTRDFSLIKTFCCLEFKAKFHECRLGCIGQCLGVAALLGM
jgi:hypothetical protein